MDPGTTPFSGSALTDRIWIFLLEITNVMSGIFVVNPPSFWDGQRTEGYFPVVSVSWDLFCTVPASSLAPPKSFSHHSRAGFVYHYTPGRGLISRFAARFIYL